MTILESILTFTGASIASGVTWDLIKSGGVKLISNFKKEFVDTFFENENECEEFFEELSRSSVISNKRPFKDAGNLYNEITDKSENEFLEALEKWIVINRSLFEELGESKLSQNVSVMIEHQENNGNGTIINAGIINNLESK